MKWQTLLLEPAIISAILNSRSAVLGQKTSKPSIICMIIAVCFGLVAASFFIGGVYVWLEALYGVQTALLLMGGAATVLSLSSYVAAKSFRAVKRSHGLSAQGDLTQRIEDFTAALLEEFEEPIRAYPKSAVSLAALAGYAIGDKVQDGTETILKTFEKMRA